LLIIILIFSTILTSGCWDSTDINEKVIMTSVMLDKKDGEIILYGEAANIEASKDGGSGGGSGAGSGGGQFLLFIGRGKTIPQARENLNLQAEKEVYISGTRTLIFTERFAKEYLVEYLNRIRYDEQYRKKVITVITKEDPEKLVKIANDASTFAGFEIDDMLQVLKKGGKAFILPTANLLENLSGKYTGILVPCIGIQDKELILNGYFPVTDSTIADFIPIKETRGILLLTAKKPILTYIVPYKDLEYTVDVRLTKRKMIPIYQNGKITFNVKCDFKAEVLYGNKKIPYGFNDTVNAEVSESLRKLIKKDINDAFDHAQKCKCDYLQCYDIFRIHYPDEIEKLDWEKEFPKITPNVVVKLDLESTSMMDYSIKEKK